jgi:hypothetical protein
MRRRQDCGELPGPNVPSLPNAGCARDAWCAALPPDEVELAAVEEVIGSDVCAGV